MTNNTLTEIEKLEHVLIPKTNILKEEVNIYCDLFINANDELKKVKESSEILDIDRLKLIFGEVNIKKEGLILKTFELDHDGYQEIEQYLSDKFLESIGGEKRALAELKAGILNAKNDNFIV